MYGLVNDDPPNASSPSAINDAARASMVSRAKSYSGLVQVRVPEQLPDMIATAADRKCTTTSEYVRRAIITQLESDGVDVSTGQHVAPGVTVWIDQPYVAYALVDGEAVYEGQLEAVSEGDKRTWLPIFHADAQPFDPRTMYREKPYLKRDGDRVLRIYPIRLKSDSYYAGDL